MSMINKSDLVACGHEEEGDCRFRHDGRCTSLNNTDFKDGFCHFRKEHPEDEEDFGENAYDALRARFRRVVGMTLKDALVELKDETGYAHIGCLTAFVVVEEASKAIAPVLLASAQMMDESKRAEERAKSKIEGLVKAASKIRESDEASWWHIAHNLREQLTQTHNMYEAQIYQLTYIPLIERKVKAAYPRIKDGYVLIIEGDENGKYWTREEYEKDNKNPG